MQFFHKSNIFGSCFIDILYTGWVKLKKNNSGAKRLTCTDPGHSHMPNSTVLQYTHCAAIHTRLQHGAEFENDFCLTITLNLIFCCYNSNKHRHTILSKSQHYKTPAATHFRSHWSIIREHTAVQTFVWSCLLVAVRPKTPHYLTFSVRHLVQSSCPRYGVYLRQPFKKFPKTARDQVKYMYNGGCECQ